MNIGILGGTGGAGRALAARLAFSGHRVTVGSRSSEKALQALEKILEQQKKRAKKGQSAEKIMPQITSGTNATAADEEMIIIATPAEAAAEAAEELSSKLSGKIVISMCNALHIDEDGLFQPAADPNKSIAQAIQDVLPESEVAAAFHHLPAKTLGDLSGPIENDVLICSDHPNATDAISTIIKSMKNLRPLNAGSLQNAGSIEAFTAVLLNLSKSYKGQASLKITGI